MGFDLSMIRPPYEIPETFPDIVRESPGYFRGVPYDTMNAAGILDHDAMPPAWPDWPPAGLKKARAEHLLTLFEPPAEGDRAVSLMQLKITFRELRVMQKYMTESARVYSARSKKQGRVPSFKFQANDGFHVTPEECLIIACRLQSYLADAAPADDDDPEWVEGFAAFNQVAAQYGGYEVN